MADLGNAGPNFGDDYVLSIVAVDADKATAVSPTTRPAVQGGLIILSPNGGIRG